MKASEARHPIGAVETRTGLSAHTIRAWEKRYGAVEPGRSEGGHRLYSDEQVRRLRLLGELTERGHRIGQIASLPTGEVEALLERTLADARSAPGARRGEPSTRSPVAEELRQELFEAIRGYDGDAMDAAFRRGALELSARELIEEVVAPLLQRVGEAWEAGEVSVAQEHLASGVVMRTLGWILDAYEASEDAPRIVVATPAGQRHNLGALLAAATAAGCGWRPVYLGGDLPAAEIAEAVRRTGARGVALSLVYPEDDPDVDAELRELRRRLPEGAAMLVGGRSAGAYAATLQEVGARLLEGYDGLRTELSEPGDRGA